MLDNAKTRSIAARVIEPVARGLLALRLTPTSVTLLGAAGVVFVAIVFIARGEWLLALVVGTPFALSDAIDGTMARLSGRVSRFGSFIDSVTDRITDGAIFGALAFWAFGQSTFLSVVTLVALIAGFATSYVRAKAESIGVDCHVGLIERPERIGLLALGGLLDGLAVPSAMTGALLVLAVLSSYTVWQRVRHVQGQLAA